MLYGGQTCVASLMDIAPSRARFLEAISMTTASNAQLLLGFMG